MTYIEIVNKLIELANLHDFVVITKNSDIEIPKTCTVVRVSGSSEQIKYKHVNNADNSYSKGFISISIKSNIDSSELERVSKLIDEELSKLGLVVLNIFNDFDYEGIPFIIYKFKYFTERKM